MLREADLKQYIRLPVIETYAFDSLEHEAQQRRNSTYPHRWLLSLCFQWSWKKNNEISTRFYTKKYSEVD